LKKTGGRRLLSGTIRKQELLPSAMQQDRALARSGKDVAARAALKRKSGDLGPHPTVNRTKMLHVKTFCPVAAKTLQGRRRHISFSEVSSLAQPDQ
jgi:hypothetical protein